MSFKREGNDKGLLDILKRRRVKELFAEGIPDDEAKLLCNGRFTCLVCSHNPIFDTVNMLMVHRQGKKHAAGEAGFLRKKKELRTLILKRKHEQYMKNGTTDIKQATPAVLGGISSSEPYDPRVKKHKVKPYERRPCLDLRHSRPSDMTDSQPQPSSSCTPSTNGLPSRHSHQLKNIFRPTQRPRAPVQPYISHRQGDTDKDRAHCSTTSSSTPQPSSSVPSVKQELSGSSASDCHHSSSVQPPSSSVNPVTSDAASASFIQAFPSSTEFTSSGSGLRVSGSVVAFGWGQNGRRTCAADTGSGNTGANPGHQRLAGGAKQPSDSHQIHGTRTAGVDSDSGAAGFDENRTKTPVQSVSSANTGERRLAQKYHLLGGSGWRKDWDGKWIRDEDAEFDSDEDPPDLP